MPHSTENQDPPQLKEEVRWQVRRSPTEVSKQSSFGSTHFDRTKLANQVTKATDAPTTISGTAYVVNTLMLVVASAAVIIYSSALPEIRTTVFLSIISFTFFAFCVSTQNMALNIRQQANRGRFLKNGFIRISPVRSIWPVSYTHLTLPTTERV